VIVILPNDTIRRILDRANLVFSAVMKGDRTQSEGPLAGTIIDALNKAKKDKANVVGPLEPHYFNDLSAWCRNVGLIQEGETVEAAVRASG
jgi:hypothetical protein